MSGIIKHDRAPDAIGRLAERRAMSGVTPRDAAMMALEARIDALEQELANERLAVERAAGERAQEARRAIAAARAEGCAAAVADDAKRIATVEAGVATALTAWRERLVVVDRLAAQLAALVLARMFGDGTDLADLVTRALAQQVALIGTHGIVDVTVSAEDFADTADLAAHVALPDAAIACSAELPAGACRLALRLGQVEIDPLRQWATFERALSTLGQATEGAA